MDYLGGRQQVSIRALLILYLTFAMLLFFIFKNLFITFHSILSVLMWIFSLFFFLTLYFLKFCHFSLLFSFFFNLQFYSVLFWGLFTLHCDFLTFVIYIPNEECRKTHSSREAGQEGSLLVYFYPYFWLRSPNPTKFLWRRAASKSLTPGCHGFSNEFCFEFQYL